MRDDSRARTNFNLSMALPHELESFLHLFYNTLYRMPESSRKNMSDSDSSGGEHYFELDKIEDDDSASDNGNEHRSTMNRLRCFNISSNSDNDDELNIDENNNKPRQWITQTFNLYIFSAARANTSRP